MGLTPFVIEQTRSGERSYDIFSRLLRDNIVFIGMTIDDRVANIVIAELLFLEAQDPERDIFLYINSPGGYVASGLAIYDTIQYIRADVHTICGFSAHADQNDLLEWVGHFESKPKVFVVHGERQASQTLADKIRERYKLETRVPRWKDRLILKPQKAAVKAPVVEEAASDTDTLVLNAIIYLEKELEEDICKDMKGLIDEDCCCEHLFNTLKKTIEICGEIEMLEVPEEVHINLHRIIRIEIQDNEDDPGF